MTSRAFLADFKTAIYCSVFFAIFNCIHFAVWNLQFVTSLGQPLWQICSVCQAVSSVFLTFWFILPPVSDNVPKLLRPIHALLTIYHMVMPYAILYLTARLVLLGLVVLSFWSLPADAYQEVNWLCFIPQWS